MTPAVPRHVTVVEVGPRDGLQNEAAHVPTAAKVAFVDALSASGLSTVEATAFVSPRAIPQLADAEAVMRAIARPRGVRFPVLVPNERGMARALSAGVRDVSVFTAASESFNRHNVNASIEESFSRFRPVVALARREGIRVRGYVSCGFGCPYEGAVDARRVAEVAARLAEEGCEEVSVGDTIGVGVPSQVAEVVGRCVEAGLDPARLALHMHDTRGTALANVVEGLRQGVLTFDSSAGGLGGCPYAPGAAGNLATEDLLYLLHGLGYETGVDAEAVARATERLAAASGRLPVSRVWQAWKAAASRSSSAPAN